jgi:hypothetical protein
MNNKLPTGIATGSTGSMVANSVTEDIAAAGSFVVPVGDYVFYAVGATTRLQVRDENGGWQNVWAVAIGGFVHSDGTNFRFQNAGGGQESVTYHKIG